MLDGLVRARLGASWERARKLVESGKVFVGGARATSGRRRLLVGEQVELCMRAPRPELADKRALAEGLIVYRDAAVVVVRKRVGLMSVPFDGTETEPTLDAVVREVLTELEGMRGRPPLGVVHRLDKATSGVLVFARSVAAKKHLASQLRAHTMHRKYLALVEGSMGARTFRTYLVDDRGDGLRGSTLPGRREGRLAVTHVTPIEHLATTTLVECRLETGRTHQIRIHLAEAGHPIVGETVYGDRRGKTPTAARLMLHAAELGFAHPNDDRPMRFHVPPPEDFERELERLRGGRSERA